MPDITPASGGRLTLETRWPCPVCAGVMMEKKRFGVGAATVMLDYCPRCGGLWFDRGEVGRMPQRAESGVHSLIIPADKRVNPPCIECGTPLDRNAERCGVCNRRNVLDCPVCDEAMERREHDGLVLDVCRRCKGVWFDNAELSAIWRLKMSEARPRRPLGRGAADAAGDVVLTAMFWTPDLLIYGGAAAGQAVGAAAEGIGSIAGSVFESVMDIISSIFE